jgi:CRISPR-associated protein Cas2
MLVVVAYDVNTETPQGRRRLRQVAKTCKKYGQRVQNSVFECSVTPSDYLTLKHGLRKLADLESDSLRFYNLGANYSNRIEHMGVQRHLPDDSVMMV